MSITDNEDSISISSLNVESHYDMNVLEEYMSLFGNPYGQTSKTIIKNVRSLKWRKEEIVSLFEEMLDDVYENLMEEDDQYNIYMGTNMMTEFKSNLKIVREENDS
jgi:hypothetical protein